MPNETAYFVRYERRHLLLIAGVAGRERAQRSFSYADSQSKAIGEKLCGLARNLEDAECDIAQLTFKRIKPNEFSAEDSGYCEAVEVDLERQIGEKTETIERYKIQQAALEQELGNYRQQRTAAEKEWKAYNSECRQYGHPIAISVLSGLMRFFTR